MEEKTRHGFGNCSWLWQQEHEAACSHIPPSWSRERGNAPSLSVSKISLLAKCSHSLTRCDALMFWALLNHIKLMRLTMTSFSSHSTQHLEEPWPIENPGLQPWWAQEAHGTTSYWGANSSPERLHLKIAWLWRCTRSPKVTSKVCSGTVLWCWPESFADTTGAVIPLPTTALSCSNVGPADFTVNWFHHYFHVSLANLICSVWLRVWTLQLCVHYQIPRTSHGSEHMWTPLLWQGGEDPGAIPSTEFCVPTVQEKACHSPGTGGIFCVTWESRIVSGSAWWWYDLRILKGPCTWLNGLSSKLWNS